ncbi:MAG: sporulation integral membrane protein YtvI [Eubacteriales bacterium]|nr:sporulation integral membrane protein YtvI [Eubacteriales bacterium]
MEYLIKYLKILLNIALWVGGALLLIFIVPRALGFFMPFVVGMVIAVIANPMVRFLENHIKVSRKFGSVLIIVGVLGFILIGGYFLVQKLVYEVIQFVNNAPQFVASMQDDFDAVLKALEELMDKLPDNMQFDLDKLEATASKYVSDLLTSISTPTFSATGRFVKSLPNAIIAFFFTILSAYFFVADKEKIQELYQQHCPPVLREKLAIIGKSTKVVAGGYFQAQFKIMAVVGLILWIGLIILGVKYSFLLALLIAFLDMLPVLGTGTVIGPWTVVKILTKDYRMAIGLVILYLLTQITRRILEPKFVGDGIGINPLLAMLYMFIGYRISGVIGMIIAIPIGVILVNFIQAGLFDDWKLMGQLVWEDISALRTLPKPRAAVSAEGERTTEAAEVEQQDTTAGQETAGAIEATQAEAAGAAKEPPKEEE